MQRSLCLSRRDRHSLPTHYPLITHSLPTHYPLITAGECSARCAYHGVPYMVAGVPYMAAGECSARCAYHGVPVAACLRSCDHAEQLQVEGRLQMAPAVLLLSSVCLLHRRCRLDNRRVHGRAAFYEYRCLTCTHAVLCAGSNLRTS